MKQKDELVFTPMYVAIGFSDIVIWLEVICSLIMNHWNEEYIWYQKTYSLHWSQRLLHFVRLPRLKIEIYLLATQYWNKCMFTFLLCAKRWYKIPWIKCFAWYSFCFTCFYLASISRYCIRTQVKPNENTDISIYVHENINAECESLPMLNTIREQ